MNKYLNMTSSQLINLMANQHININVQTFLVLITVFLFIINLVRMLRMKSYKLPPGPLGLPIVGAIPLLGSKPYLKVQQWWNTYGDIFSMYMGSRLVVVINGVDVMKECFIRQADIFNARPWNYFKKLTNNTGIVFTEGEIWKEHRRFTISCLRDFGMGRISLEEKIHEETRVLLTEFQNEDGRPFDVRLHVPKAVSNIICSIIYGTRFEYDDPVFQANIQALDQSVRNQSLLGLIQFIPFLEFLPKILPVDKMLAKNVKMRDDFANEQYELHMETFDEYNPRDFIDAYVAKMTNKLEKKEKTTFADAQLKRTIQDLFIAGTETTNTTMKWSLLFMALHPDIQCNVQSEIDEVLGRGRLPTMKDRYEMPYTEATINECQRLGNIALFSVPRCVTKDTKVNGFDVPKGTWIFINRWGMHSSSRYWKDPSKFDPQRFLKDGKAIRPESFVPFGVGPRSCLGEGLARMELFIFFTSILQAFNVHLPENQPPPRLDPKPGINMSPYPYTICMKHR